MAFASMVFVAGGAERVGARRGTDTTPEIVAVSAVGTPLGAFGGALRDVPVFDLGAAAIAAALRRAGIVGAQVDEVVFANCRQAGNGLNPARLAKLKPVFKRDGSVTAGNACSMGDGAAAIVLTTREHARALGAAPLFSIVSFAQAAVDPATMGEGPAVAIPLALEHAGMALRDMDAIEVNRRSRSRCSRTSASSAGTARR
jgi:acetyl-CoA acetyltransferase